MPKGGTTVEIKTIYPIPVDRMLSIPKGSVVTEGRIEVSAFTIEINAINKS